jgi:hypothetical protein
VTGTLTFETKHKLARDILRKAIREQLERSSGAGPITAESDLEVVTAELVATLTRPSLATALQILAVAHAGPVAT